jgi:hypothetical protein
LCRIERWSFQTLPARIDGMLYEWIALGIRAPVFVRVVQFAELFSDSEIIATPSRQFGWGQFIGRIGTSASRIVLKNRERKEDGIQIHHALF